MGTIGTVKPAVSATNVLFLDRVIYGQSGEGICSLDRTMHSSLMQVGENVHSFGFEYDACNQLTSGTLGIKSVAGTACEVVPSFTLANVLETKIVAVNTSSQTPPSNASALTYNLEYTYNSGKAHQLDQVWDPTNGTLTKFTYNTSGSVTQIDDSSQPVAQDFFWNEQQQLTGVKNQQGVHHYVYDHSGERIMKSSLINSTVYLNDQVIDDVNNLDPYTVYVNPFYVVTGLLGGDRVSKHYYMNQQRVATDISINVRPLVIIKK
jgi:YD repeat-containing protein